MKLKLTPPKKSTFMFAFWVGIASFICFAFGVTTLAYFLALAALVDILAGNYFEGY
jgi:hypothetical protein